MNKLPLLILFILLVACSKKTSPQEAPAAGATLAIPASCALTSTGAHVFKEWGSEIADNYSCSVDPKLTCNLSQSIDHSEATCVGANPLFLYGAPAGCQSYSSGMHVFLDGSNLTAAAYDCGANLGALRCFYYLYDDSVHANRREELICLDNESLTNHTGHATGLW